MFNLDCTFLKDNKQ